MRSWTASARGSGLPRSLRSLAMTGERLGRHAPHVGLLPLVIASRESGVAIQSHMLRPKPCWVPIMPVAHEDNPDRYQKGSAMGITAYKQVVKATAEPRQIEYRLFQNTTSKLRDHRGKRGFWEVTAELKEALW